LAKQPNQITNTNPDNEIDAEIQQKQLIYCINQLKEKEQQVIILKIFEELTFWQIAELLGKKESTIKMAYYHGLAKIKKIAEKNFSSTL
jgi:RNA polymerase sigma-70 factor (ECF subfamily)